MHNTPGYRCRYGHTSAARNTDPDQPKIAYLPEKTILAKLPLLYTRLTATSHTAAITGDAIASAAGSPASPSPQEMIDHLREYGLVLGYDSRTRKPETGGSQPVRVTV